MSSSPVETEIKLPVKDLAEIRLRVERAGFTVAKPRVFEANDLYDTPDQRFRSSDEILRVRQVGDSGVITFKAKGTAGRHKSRAEIETGLDDPTAMRAILQRCGFKKSFRYEKYRTEYRRRDDPGVLVVDETPIGNFLELEGPPEWIDRVAPEVGFAESDYITKSYGALYIESCRAAGKPLANMVFETPTVE
jgi:adenylate cyclase class 2